MSNIIVANTSRYLRNLIELRDKFTDEAFYYFLTDFGTDDHSKELPGDNVYVHGFFQIGWGHSVIGFAAYNEIGGMFLVPNTIYDYTDVRQRYVIKIQGSDSVYDAEAVKYVFGPRFYDHVKPDPDKRNLTVKAYMDSIRTIINTMISELQHDDDLINDRILASVNESQRKAPETVEFTGKMPVPVAREELQAIRDKVESQGDIWVAKGIEMINERLRAEVAKDILTSLSNCSVSLTGTDLRDAMKATPVPPKVWIRIAKVFNDADYFASIMKSMDGGVVISLRVPDSGGLTSR